MKEWKLVMMGCRVSFFLEEPNWVLLPGHGSPGLLPLYSSSTKHNYNLSICFVLGSTAMHTEQNVNIMDINGVKTTPRSTNWVGHQCERNVTLRFAPGFGLDFYAVIVNNDHICWDSPISSLCQGSMEKTHAFCRGDYMSRDLVSTEKNPNLV